MRIPWRYLLHLARGIVAMGGAIQVATFISGVLVARMLGPDLRGQLGIIILWPFLASTLIMISLNDVASYLILSRRTSAVQAYWGSLAIALVSSAICIAIFAILSVVGAHVESRHLSTLMLLYSTVSVPNAITSIAGNVFLAEGRKGYWGVVRVWAHIVYALAVLPIYLFGRDVLSGIDLLTVITAVSLGANWSGVIGTAIMLKRSGTRFVVPRQAEIGEIARAAAKIHVANIPQMITGYIDQVVFSVSLATAEFGLVLVASAIVRAGLFVTSGLAQSLVPSLFDGSFRQRYASFISCCTVIAAISLPYMVLVDVAAHFLVPVVYGRAYNASSTLVLVLGFQLALQPMRTLIVNGLRAIDAHSTAAALEWSSIICVLAFVPVVSVKLGAFCGVSSLVLVSLATCVAGVVAHALLSKSKKRVLAILTRRIFRPAGRI